MNLAAWAQSVDAALVHGMTVVTRNVDDFRPTKVPIINPWLASEVGAYVPVSLTAGLNDDLSLGGAYG